MSDSSSSSSSDANERDSFDEEKLKRADDSESRSENSDASSASSSSSQSQSRGDDTDGSASGSASSSEKVKRVIPKTKDNPLGLSRRQLEKQKRRERKEAQPHGAIIAQCVALWEKAREKKHTPERDEAIMKTVRLLKGRVADTILKHDAARVVGTVLEHGTPEQRNVIIDELSGKMTVLAKNKYARFVANRILTYSRGKQRDKLLREFSGKMRSLVKHPCGNYVLEHAYVSVANAEQRRRMHRDFYGPHYLLVTQDNDRQFDDVMQQESEELRAKILGFMHRFFLKTFGKRSTLVSNQLLHYVIRQYFTYCTAEQAAELVPLMSERVVEMLHTKEGAHCGWYCLTLGTAKDRKKIARTMKTLVTKAACEEYGHLVLMRLLDCTDDTKMLRGTVLDELAEHLDEIMLDRHGRLIVLHLLAPHSARHFPDDVLKLMRATMAVRDGTAVRDINVSKKDASLRQAELLAPIARALVDAIERNMRTLLTDVLLIGIAVEALQCEYLRAKDDDAEPLRKEVADAFFAQLFDGDEEAGAELWCTVFMGKWLKYCIHHEVRVVVGGTESAPQIKLFGNVLLDRLSDINLCTKILSYGNSMFVISALLSAQTIAEADRQKFARRVSACVATLDDEILLAAHSVGVSSLFKALNNLNAPVENKEHILPQQEAGKKRVSTKSNKEKKKRKK